MCACVRGRGDYNSIQGGSSEQANTHMHNSPNPLRPSLLILLTFVDPTVQLYRPTMLSSTSGTLFMKAS